MFRMRRYTRPTFVAVVGWAFLLHGCGDSAGVALEPATGPLGISGVSGDNQEGRERQLLREDLAVRVTDAGGRGVAGVTVRWQVAAGAGDFWLLPNVPGSVSTTNREGVAGVGFRPAVRGTTVRIQAVADHPELTGSPVGFTANVINVAVVLFGPMFDCGPSEPSLFVGPDTVPVGVPVEWVYATSIQYDGCGGHVTSTSAPPGGENFDSGIIPPKGTFRFVPRVAGTWRYVDPRNGGSATLTATEGASRD